MSSLVAAKRPEYKPRLIKCNYCGGAIRAFSDATASVRCDNCNRILDLSDAEQKILGMAPERARSYPLAIGAEVKLQGHIYEVAGRIASRELGESSLTHSYFLYHPRFGSLWLEEFEGSYSWTKQTRVLPMDANIVDYPPENMRTGDGQDWVLEENGRSEVVDVDGSFPHKVRIGDVSLFRDYRKTDAHAEFYSVEVVDRELSFSEGRLLSKAEAKAALGGRVETADYVPPDRSLRATLRKFALMSAGLAILVFLFRFSAAGSDELASGELDLNNAPLMTDVVTIPDGVSRISIEFRASGLSNSWSSINAALTKEDGDTVVHVLDSTFEYYSGVEGGESWSESRLKDRFIVEMGDLRKVHLLLDWNAESEAIQLGSRVGVRYKISTMPFMQGWLTAAGVIAFLFAILFGWASLHEEDD